MKLQTYEYAGSELELFADALNWKAYLQKLLRKCFQGEVLEVGAGIGGTTRILCDGSQNRWVCLEPDADMACTLSSLIERGELPACCELIVGTLSNLAPQDKYDSVIYIDVIEHIENDGEELKTAASFLKDYGFLVVLAPAHQWLFSPFDRVIGHFRRYDRKTLSEIVPETLRCVELKYLDSVGLLASLGNKIFLQREMPTRRHIRLWDTRMVLLSRMLDPLLGYRVGKSILGIWKK